MPLHYIKKKINITKFKIKQFLYFYIFYIFVVFFSARPESRTGSTWPTAPTATSWSNARPSTSPNQNSTRSSESRTCWTDIVPQTRSNWTQTGSRSLAEAIDVCREMLTAVEMEARQQMQDWLIQKVSRAPTSRIKLMCNFLESYKDRVWLKTSLAFQVNYFYFLTSSPQQCR